jgi:hypothetical protein
MSKQGYRNYRKYSLPFHGILYPLILGTIITSIINLKQGLENRDSLLQDSIFVLISVTFGVMCYVIRIFALKLQDRIIRTEENLRHFALTGKQLDPRLSTRQIIALRFSPDNEFIDLCNKAVNKQLTPSEIKKSISNWRADYRRV